MKGKITTSRIGIIGRRLVSDFSFEVSILSSRRATGTVHHCSASVLLKQTGAFGMVLLLTDDRSSTGDSKVVGSATGGPHFAARVGALWHVDASRPSLRTVSFYRGTVVIARESKFRHAFSPATILPR
jgi:hypothetical protein